MLSIAALLSKGEPLPFTETEENEPMTIIYQTTEDDADDTVVPRFNSAGGNGENLIFIKEDEKSLSFGDNRIAEAIEKYHARLLILDPMSSYIGENCSMNNANETRAEFNHLIAVAKDTGCAIVIIAHMNKIHNHIIYNSTALDSTRKFRDFLLSGLAVQRLSDLICLEHQLSIIEIKPYRERQKRTLYPPKESNRDRLRGVIDNILSEKPKDYEDFLQELEQQGYEVKRGKYTSVKGARQKRFIRFRTLGAGYSEEELKAVISGEAEHHPRQKQKRIVPEQKFQMLVDIQAKLAEEKSMGYARWAKRYNLKEMSKTLIFLQEHKIGSIKELQERVDAATARYHELGDSIKAAEARMAEIAVLRTHIVNYARTRPVYDAYRKAGYSKRFLEAHREEITLHKAAKAAFDEAGLKKLPKAKDLSIEYAELLKKKKEAYPDYRKARDEMQELMKAQKNVEMFFAEEKDTAEKEPTR